MVAPGSARSRLPALIGLTLVFGSLLVGIGILALSDGSLPGDQPLRGRVAVMRLVSGLGQDGSYLGDEDAPVTVAVFNDLQCLDCSAWQRRVVPRLVSGLLRPGQARLALHHFPMGARSRGVAAIAAAAAGRQDRQWNYAELVLRNQALVGKRGLDEELLTRIARAIPGLDLDRWKRDRRGSEVDARLEADDTLSRELRLPARPAALVEGPGGSRELTGAPSAAQILEAARAVGG